jgi:hypothetical protein
MTVESAKVPKNMQYIPAATVDPACLRALQVLKKRNRSRLGTCV